jgi:hypothetical protein
MSKTRLVMLLVALATLVLPAAASAAINPLEPGQWYANPGPPQTGKLFQLSNRINASKLGHGEREIGVDLSWAKGGDWLFSREPYAGRRDHRSPITSLERVALFNTKARRFLVYGRQKYGINLNWSTSPSYEWKVDHDISIGAFSLYNVRVGDFLVHGKRTWGINLRWLKDRGYAHDGYGVGTVHEARVTLYPQREEFGHFPFVGRFGGGADGAKAQLLRITNPVYGQPLAFLRHRRATDECGQPNATVSLKPGEPLVDLGAIFGSLVPSLLFGLPLQACGAPAAGVVVIVRYKVTG